MFLYLLTSCLARKVPVWFDNYHMVLTLDIPGRGLAIPISVVQADRYEYNSLLKVEFYQGLQQEFTSNFLGKVKYVFRNGERVCLQDLTPQDPPANDATFLPDLYDYNFAGVELVDGIWADKYTQNVPHISAAGDSSGMFDRISFYYDPVTNKPLKWSMHARNQIFSSHTDEYVVTYHEYKRSIYPVIVPDLCIKSPTKAKLNLQLHAFFKRFSVDTKVTNPNIHDNLRTVQNLNAQHNLTEFRLNHFSHMKEIDIIQRSTGYRFSQKKKVQPTPITELRRTPHAFDWREVDEVVPPVKDQDMCGSCWAFSMISAMESAHGLLTGKLTVLAEQAIIDCVWSDANNACDGGQPEDAADDIIKRFNGNVPSEKAYGTYLSVDGKCSDRMHDISGARLLSWLVVPARDDVQVTQALLSQPLSVAIAVTREMIWYGKGILDVPACKVSNEDLNHAVNLIGYGTEEKDFWLLRNSWSRHWGEGGYVKIVRGENDCGVTLQAQFPIVGALIDDVIV